MVPVLGAELEGSGGEELHGRGLLQEEGHAAGEQEAEEQGGPAH